MYDTQCLTNRSSSIVFTDLQQHQQSRQPGDIGLAILYFRHDSLEQSVEAVMGSLLKQLIICTGKMPESVSRFQPDWDAALVPPPREFLQNEVCAIAASFRHVYIIVDALDECADQTRWDILEHLRGLGPQVHLLITSRNYDTIKEELVDFANIEVAAQKDDIDLFIEHQVGKNKKLERLVAKKPAILDEIKTQVADTAQGMSVRVVNLGLPLADRHIQVPCCASACCVFDSRCRFTG